jgi:hypothetical protein
MRVLRGGAVFACITVMVVLLWSAPALAKLYRSSSERQVVPGITERTIWSEDQVAAYRLPKNVTHTGYIHVELDYKPRDRDCFVYLLDANGQVLPGTYSQGRTDLSPGVEVIDYQVTNVVNSGWNEPDGSDVAGDAYYILVEAGNGNSSYKLRGYYPRAEAGSDDTTSDATLTRGAIQVPAKASKWAHVSGAPYGQPWDFTPTSQGTVYTRLEYTATARKHSLAPPSTSMPAAFEQYVYPELWQPATGSLPVDQPCDASHWDLWHLNRHDSAAPVAGGTWYGLEGTFAVQNAGPFKPNSLYHYVPMLWMVSSQPAAGPAAPPAVGTRKIGYKATLLIPQNLYFAKATRKVRRNREATLKGSLALPASAAAGAQVSWAPAGTKVTIQRRAGKKWVKVKNVTVRANGAWRTAVRMKRTTTFRASWPSSGGLATERSLSKTVTVRR